MSGRPTHAGTVVATVAGADIMSHHLVAALDANGVPATTWFYGGATHSRPYWEDDLRQCWPRAMAAMGAPPAGGR